MVERNFSIVEAWGSIPHTSIVFLLDVSAVLMTPFLYPKPTQQERAEFYQTYTLRLLECKNFIGWHWFQYIDNDPHPEVIFKEDGKTWRDQSSIDANKGIVDNYHKPYETLMKAMYEVNSNVYRLIDHFDAKYSK